MIPRLLAPAVLIALGVLAATAKMAVPTPTADTQFAPLRCLIVGGGPDRRNNPVALENNIAYVQSLLPAGSQVRVLYASADLTAPIVRVETELPSGAPWVSYRPSQLKRVDGPATLAAFDSTLGGLADHSGDPPLLLYFTGHGSPDPGGDYTNNDFELWNGEQLDVTDLTQALGELPPNAPVTLVMVQCFSGAFADALFAGSEGDRPVVRARSCGFFASIPSREAAGCTPDINQADYKDFTTYFFGALTGRDRVGRQVPSADYDHDGVVEMDEAYAYTLEHDQSIDTPIDTADAYVRRFTDTPDSRVFHTTWTQIISYATPAQRAALEALSDELKLTGEERAERAYETVNNRVNGEDEDETEEDDEQTARWIRLARLCKTVVLERQIRQNGPPDVRDGLQQITAAEHAPLLPPAAADQGAAISQSVPPARQPASFDPVCGCSE